MSRFIKIVNTDGDIVLLNIESIGYIQNLNSVHQSDVNRIFVTVGPLNHIETTTTLEDLEEMLK